MATCKILFFLLLALCIWCGKCEVLYQRVGDEVTMKCGVDSNSNVEWKFNGELILSIDGRRGTRRKGNIQIANKVSAYGETLKVPKLETRDAGDYFCRQSGKQFALHVVSVFAKPGPVLVQSSDAALHCDITGNPDTKTVSQRVVGGKWKADHLPTVSFPNLTNTASKSPHWNGEDSSKVNFTTGQLSTNFDVTLKNVQSSDEGTFVCTVEFEGGAILSVETTLRVVAKPSDGQGSTKGKGKTPAAIKTLTKEVYGVKLWIWIAVGASSLVLIGLIVVAVFVHKRNKQKKQRVRKLRSMRQPLTAKDYCQCSRAENEVELGQPARPLPVPRQHRNPRTRTAGTNDTN